MIRVTATGFQILQPGEVPYSAVPQYLLGRLVDRNCQRVSNELYSVGRGDFTGCTPRAMLRQMRADYDAECKELVNTAVASESREDVRMLFGGLLTELVATYTKAYEYVVCKNRYVRADVAVSDARKAARSLEDHYEAELLKIVAPDRNKLEFASCYVPLGYAQWMPDVGRGDIVMMRADATASDGHVAMRNLRIPFEVGVLSEQVLKPYGIFERMIDELIVPKIENSVAAIAKQSSVADFVSSRAVRRVGEDVYTLLRGAGINSWYATADRACPVSFPRCAA
jgi:hypothetical protein